MRKKTERTKSTDYTDLLYRPYCANCGFMDECRCRFIKILQRMPTDPKDRRFHEWETDPL